MNTQEYLCAALSFMLAFTSALADEHVDPAEDDSQYAWAANLGWINGEPLGDGGPGVGFIDTKVVGWLWSTNAGWLSLNCINTGSCGDVAYGVNHDGTGNLSGYAWSPNLGWISFSCADSKSCENADYSVSVDLSSGEMSGLAYAANAGWLSFSCTNSASCAMVDFGIRVDADSVSGDLLSDGFESP